MSTDPKLVAAYDRAIAVMSQPCRFVEYKTYAGGKNDKGWFPVGLSDDPAGFWKEIEGERWIYVFRRYARTKSNTVWVEEIHLPEKGGKDRDMSAASMAGALAGDDDRGELSSVGKTISFARRIHGVAMEYYFFATRIRLPAKMVDDFMADVTSYVHPVNFEANDRNIVGKDGGVLLVPVLDPLTVAEHLHAYFVAAEEDYLEYQFVHAKMADDKKRAVLKRQKKVALARLIDELQLADKSNHLVHWLKRQGLDLEDFLKEYEGELAFRRRWRGIWCKFLTDWLGGTTMTLLAKAHAKKADEHFAQYLTVYCMCVTRVSSCSTGLDFLAGIAADKKHWMHTYVLLDKKPSETAYQVIRKSTSAALEALKEWAPLAMREEAVLKWSKFHEAIGWIAEKKMITIDGEVFTWTEQKVVKTRVSYHVFEGEPPAIKPAWKGAMTSTVMILEIINVAYAIRGVRDAMDGDDRTQQVLAFTNLVGSGLDLTSAGLGFFKVSDKALGRVALVSSIIDTFLAYKDEADAYQKGDIGATVGSAAVAVGSFEGAVAGLAMLAGVPGAQIVALVGLLIVAIGQMIKLATHDSQDPDDSPYFQLVNFCEWGLQKSGDDDTASFSPKPFSEWKGDIDAQLTAAVNLLCGFSLERNEHYDGALLVSDDLREAKLSARWFPPGSVLRVKFEEKWAEAVKNRVWKADFVTGEKGLVAEKGAQLRLVANGKDAYLLRPIPYAGEAATQIDGEYMTGKKLAPGLQSIHLEARLHIKLADREYLVPHDKDVGLALH
jgi:hypothetical protein